MSELTQQLGGFAAADSILDGDGVTRQPTAEELERPIVAPGTGAHLPWAIEYQANWDMLEDGLSRHARAQVRALSRAGLPVVLRRLARPKFIMEDEVDPSVLASVGYLRDTMAASIPVAIRQLVIHSAAALETVVAPAGSRLAGFGNEMKVYESTIVYTPWERTTVSPDIVEVLNRCAEVWVQGEWAVEVFKDAGVRRVYSIPVPYDPDTNLACHISAPRGSETVPPGKLFYAIGKWEPRKNYHALLGAFLLEFSPHERASLFLKTHEWAPWEGYPSVAQSIEYWLAQPEVKARGWIRDNYGTRVRIISKKLPDEQIAKIHRMGNIYVTCSHGEGWDMSAFDARSAGNRMVYTGWGGPTEFAGEDDVCLWGTGQARCAIMEPVHAGYGWEESAQWAAIDFERLRQSLRLAQPPARRVHPPSFYSKFGLQAVGEKMAERIADRFPEAYGKLKLAGGFG